MSKATDDVLAERQRQIEAEGWTEEHDDEHEPGALALAGTAYAYHAASQEKHGVSARHYAMPPRTPWPWDSKWWKPKNARRDLVRAAALLIAEIERLDRQETKTPNVKWTAYAPPILSLRRPFWIERWDQGIAGIEQILVSDASSPG